jgi:hypothetical protein
MWWLEDTYHRLVLRWSVSNSSLQTVRHPSPTESQKEVGSADDNGVVWCVCLRCNNMRQRVGVAVGLRHTWTEDRLAWATADGSVRTCTRKYCCLRLQQLTSDPGVVVCRLGGVEWR